MKTIASEYKRRRKAGTAAEEYRARQGVPKAIPSPSSPPAEAQPPAKVDTATLEAIVREATNTMGQAVAKLSAEVAARNAQRVVSYSVRVNSRDGNHNIKSLTVTPTREGDGETRH